MNSPKIVTAILCEDVRTEKNGKQIIIGVYPSDIVISKIPAHLSTVLWIQIDNIGPENKNFEFRGSLSGKDIIKGGFIISTLNIGDRATISLGNFPLIIKEEGDLKFDIRFADGGRWQNAITIPVKIRLDSSASQQPSEQSQSVAS